MSNKKLVIVFFYLFLVSISFSQDYEVLGSKEDLSEEPIYTSLKKAIRQKELVKILNLSNQGLTELPPEIKELKNLIYLYIDSNELVKLPKWIGELKELSVITATYNKIDEIPESIDKLYQLKYLNLGHNNIKLLTPALCRLNSLVSLNLDYNSIDSLPTDIKQFSSIERLRLSNNKITSIPKEIISLYNIITLDLSRNLINELPEELFELKQMEYLFLESNSLKKIPSKISYFKQLKTLLVSDNNLSVVPNNFNELYNLEVLSLANNNFDTLPYEISKMIGLTYLNLSNNPFMYIPDSYKKLKNLKKLYIENHKLSSFPQVLYDIQNNNTNIYGLKTKELYTIRLLFSKARNKKLVKEYSSAIEKYQEILSLDTNNIQAMIELTSTYLEIDEYDNALLICERALKNDVPIDQLKELKILHNYSSNKTSKDESIVDSYKTSIKDGVDKADANFDLGYYYFNKEDYNGALKYFEEALLINFSHNNANFYYAVTNKAINNRPAFLFSTLFFLLQTENDRRTSSIFPFLMLDLKMKTGIEGKKGSVSYYDDYVIRNNNNEIVYQGENPAGDLLIAMLSDLLNSDKINIKQKGKPKEDSLVKGIIDTLLHVGMNNVEILKYELTNICSEENEIINEDTFYYLYYYPFFKKLIEKKYLETFSYIIINKRNKETYIDEWLNHNQSKVEEFMSWVKAYDFKIKP